jgi:hypothetical protein
MEGKLRFGGKFDLDRGEIDRELRISWVLKSMNIIEVEWEEIETETG